MPSHGSAPAGAHLGSDTDDYEPARPAEAGSMARVRNAYRFCQNSNPWLYYAIGLTTFMSVMVMVMQTHDREIPDWVNTTVGGVWGCATALILFFNAFRKISFTYPYFAALLASYSTFGPDTFLGYQVCVTIGLYAGHCFAYKVSNRPSRRPLLPSYHRRGRNGEAGESQGSELAPLESVVRPGDSRIRAPTAVHHGR